MVRDDRPLSPHLGIYRWQISNTLSILHRMTGVVLSLGALGLTWWLVALALGEQSYATAHAVLAGPLGMLLLFGCTFCLFYHFANGIRHLFWDAGMGFEIPRARLTGVLVIVFSTLATAGVWALIMLGGV